MNFKRLISEDCEHVSLGRTTFWLLFFASIYYWLYLKQEVPDTLFNSWWIVLIYNFGKKGLNVANNVFTVKNSNKGGSND